jgi:hypothetical protein
MCIRTVPSEGQIVGKRVATGTTTVALMLLAPCLDRLAAGQPPLVTVSYRGPARVVLHEPVLVELKIENFTNGAIHYDLGFNRTSSFFMTITHPDGTIVRASPPAVDGPMRIGRVSVAGHASYSQELLLNDWARFDEAGVYHVRITSTTTITTEQGDTVDTRTGGAVQFQIAVDEGALDERCRQLADIATTDQNAWRAQNAARLLTYVDDPVGIRYMRRVLDVTELLDPIILHGLARINSAEARAALAETALGGSPERMSSASQVLRWAEARRP